MNDAKQNKNNLNWTCHANDSRCTESNLACDVHWLNKHIYVIYSLEYTLCFIWVCCVSWTPCECVCCLCPIFLFIRSRFHVESMKWDAQRRYVAYAIQNYNALFFPQWVTSNRLNTNAITNSWMEWNEATNNLSAFFYYTCYGEDS